MKAVTLGKDGVEIKELPEPKPQNQQILVKVKSCGLNRSDLLETCLLYTSDAADE